MNNYNYLKYGFVPNESRNNTYPFMDMNDFKNQSLYAPKVALEKGNLFQNLYSQYKNYQPASLNPRTDKEKRLQEIQALCFAAHELNLYLDLHPEDQSMVTLFNDYRRRKEELVKSYEEQYGPFTVDSESMEDSAYEWVNSAWPWEVNNV